MTTAIAFNGGAYGTYLEWCLTTLSSTDNIVPPFSSIGNSHSFKGNHLADIAGWKSFKLANRTSQFVRLHPKTRQDESLSANMNYLCSTTESVVYLYPNEELLLLLLNNFTYKIWEDWWEHSFSSVIDVDKIYNNWPVSKATTISNIPNWIKREFLSFYLMPAWFSQIEWNHLDIWNHPKCCIVTVDQLLHDFEHTIYRIRKHCNLQFKRDVVELLPFHQQNLTLQKYIGQDQICNQIIDAAVNNQPFEWEELTLTSESWVQWELRNRGFEIRCDGLDMFPTNSIQLRELLYTV
jgi:hypothetical protein